MGEIIRNLETVDFNNLKFDIELNKSSDKTGYKDIHIQNKKFRFELKEDEFIKIASCIIYAQKQLTNIKEEHEVVICENVHVGDYLDGNKIALFFRSLNEEGVLYFVEKNIEDEMPNRLVVGKDIDIVVASHHIKKMNDFLKKNGFHKIEHPKSSNNGYVYTYGLDEPTMWRNEKSGIIVDLATKLMVNSLTPNTVVPLNDDINCGAWDNKYFDVELDAWRMGSVETTVYLIARAMFNKHGFSANYIREIEKNKDALRTERAHTLLKNVTFSFTDELLRLIENHSYSKIFEEYCSFVNY